MERLRNQIIHILFKFKLKEVFRLKCLKSKNKYLLYSIFNTICILKKEKKYVNDFQDCFCRSSNKNRQPQINTQMDNRTEESLKRSSTGTKILNLKYFVENVTLFK